MRGGGGRDKPRSGGGQVVRFIQGFRVGTLEPQARRLPQRVLQQGHVSGIVFHQQDSDRLLEHLHASFTAGWPAASRL
jgi:hypothetical protein